nr:alpha-(1,3)-fucosyltransferase C-like [Vanessa tameamea]
MKDIKKYRNNKTIFTFDFERPRRIPEDLKFILNWNDGSFNPGLIFKSGQKSFIDQNCTYYNCYFTRDRSLLIDLRYFDAIVFDVDYDWDDHPPLRILNQKYIFSATESASSYPICNPIFDNYYNLSWTYKLNSDIIKSLITILDINGNIIGPKANMTWISPMLPTSEAVKRMFMKKKKAAASFTYDCDSKNSLNRQILVKDLNKLLSKANFTLEIFGWCGHLTCPRDRIEECLSLLKKEYFFYLVFENNLSEDYISKEILYPLLHYAVPIVYGGADYNNYLPPNSYIDARKLSLEKVATLMIKAIQNPEIYNEYFRWHNHYRYREARQDYICNLCLTLNEPAYNQSVIQNFREWWNPNYKEYC